jgi:hypothetical protein
MLVSCFAYSSSLRMGSICCSEISFDFHRCIRRFILKDRLPHITALKQNFASAVDLFNDAFKIHFLYCIWKKDVCGVEEVRKEAVVAYLRYCHAKM